MHGRAGTFPPGRGSEPLFKVGSRSAAGSKLAANFDLIGDDVAVSIAYRIDLQNREASVAQRGKRLLQRVVKVVLERWSLFRRGENPRVDTIGLLRILLRTGDEFDLRGTSRQAHLRLVMKPARRSPQHEKQKDEDGEVVLPCAALIRPEKRASENRFEAGHFSRQGRRRRSRHRAYARRGRRRCGLPDCAL